MLAMTRRARPGTRPQSRALLTDILAADHEDRDAPRRTGREPFGPKLVLDHDQRGGAMGIEKPADRAGHVEGGEHRIQPPALGQSFAVPLLVVISRRRPGARASSVSITARAEVSSPFDAA